MRYIPAFRDCIIKTRSVMAEASCSKKVTEKSVVNVEFSANIDSQSDEENTPDVIGNEEYDFLFDSDDIYSDFEGLMRRKYFPLIPTSPTLKTGAMIKIQMILQMFSKKQL